jgi:hypothetical protein
MGGVLTSLWSCNAEFGECLGNVTRHGRVNGVSFVVPAKSDSAVEFAGPVCGGGVEVSDGSDKMFCVFLSNVFYA